jgi:hypothetical protein
VPIRVGFSNLPAPGRPGAWGLGPGAASAAQGPTGPSSDNSVMCHVAVPAGSDSDGSGSLTAEVAGKSAAVLAWGMLIDAVLIAQNFSDVALGRWPRALAEGAARSSRLCSAVAFRRRCAARIERGAAVAP